MDCCYAKPLAAASAITGLVLSAAVTAEEGARFAAPATSVPGASAMTGGGAMQVLLSLAIVIGAIVLLGWLARRLRVMPRGRSGALRVVDEVALGAKERAVILEVDGARLVLGVGEGRVMLLHRGEAAAQRAMDPAEVSAVSSGGDTIAQPSFGDLLQKALGR